MKPCRSPLLDRAAMQVGLDLQMHATTEAGSGDRQVLHHPLHIVAGFGEGDQLDPVDCVHLGIARIAIALDPLFEAAAAGIIGGERHDVGAAVILEEAAELGGLLEDYRGSYIMTFAAYNAGRGSLKKWIDRYGDPRDPKVDAVDWVELIPFSETRNYVQRVMENLQVYRARFGGGMRLQIEADLHRGAVE